MDTAGDHIREEVDKAIEIANVFIMLIGNQWSSSNTGAIQDRKSWSVDREDDWIRVEVRHALERRKSGGLDIIPVVWKDARFAELLLPAISVLCKVFCCLKIEFAAVTQSIDRLVAEILRRRQKQIPTNRLLAVRVLLETKLLAFRDLCYLRFRELAIAAAVASAFVATCFLCLILLWAHGCSIAHRDSGIDEWRSNFAQCKRTKC